MKDLFQQVRRELVPDSERLPPLVLLLAGLIALAPLTLLFGGVADAVVSAAAVIFLIRSAINRDIGWARQPWVLIGLAIWLYLVGRGLASVDPERSGVKALPWVRFVVFGAAVQFVLLRSAGMRRALLGSICVMALFGAADALFQFVVGYDITGRPKEGNRLTGPLPLKAIGMLLIFAGMPAIFYLLNTAVASVETIPKRVWAAIGFLIIYAAVVLSGERMVLIQSLAVLFLYFVLVGRPSLRTAGIAVGLAFVVAGTMLALFPQIRDRHLSTVTQIAKAGDSIYGQAMLAGVEVFKDNPVFGVGLKNFQSECPKAVEDPVVKERACKLIHPHQMWIHIGAEAGLIGILAFLVLFYFALGPAVMAWRTWQVEPLLAGAAVSVLLRLWPLSTSGNFFSNWREAIFWLMLGIATAVPRRAETSDKSVRG